MEGKGKRVKGVERKEREGRERVKVEFIGVHLDLETKIIERRLRSE